ncbi:MAG: DUF3857 domain-containing protein [Verrucomicrobiota bacterium]
MSLLATSSADPSSAPYLIGQFTWLIIGLIVIAIQFPKLKEKGRSRMATLALMVFWLGAGMMTLISVFKNSSSLTSPVLVGLFALICFALIISSIVLAIIGLTKTFGSHSQRLTGRGAAIWTLCLSGLVMAFAGVGFFKAIKGQVSADRELMVAESEKKLRLDSDKGVMAIEDEESNFRFELSGKDWIELDTQKINPDIDFMASNKRLCANVMVIAEVSGIVEYELEPIAQVIRQRALAAYPGSKATEFYDGEIGGRKVRRMEAESQRGINVIEFQFTLFQENGMFYQVVTSHTGNGRRDQNKKVTESILRSFETIDPEFGYKVSSASRVESVSSDLGGLAIDLRENGWQKWELIEKEASYADDGALYGVSAGIELVATNEVDPNESQSAIDDMFLKVMDIDLEHVDKVIKKTAEIDGRIGTEYLILDEREGGNYWFRIRIAKVQNLAVAVAVWWAQQTENSSIKSTLENAIERASFDPDAAKEPAVYTEKQKESQAEILNNLGLYHFARSRYGAALEYFRRSFELNPDYLVYQQNVLRAAYEGEFTREGLQLVEKNWESVQSDPQSQTLYAIILAQDGKFELAAIEMRSAIENGYDDSDDLLAIVNLIIDGERHEVAAAVMRTVIAQGESERYSVWLAAVLRLGETFDEAEAALEPYVNEGHISIRVAEELVEIKTARGLVSEALEVANRALEVHPDSPDAIELKLDALVELGWLAEAHKTVQLALEQFPERESLINYQEWLDSQVGIDDLSLVSSELKSVGLPEPLAEIMFQVKEAETPEAWQEREVIYDYIVTGYYFEPGEPVRKTVRRRARINTRRAVEYFSTLTFSFDRDGERFFVNRIEVFDEHGVSVASAKRDAFYLSEQSDTEMASDEVTLYAPVNGLAQGYALEWETTWEDTYDSDEFPYSRRYFSSSYPVFEFAQYVIGSIDEVEVVSEKVTQMENLGEGEIAWRLANSPGTEFESSMPDFRELLPVVDLGSNKRSWGEVALEYLKDIEPQLTTDQTMEAVVRDLDLEGLGQREKVMLLVRLVQDRVVYKALEFGATSYIPDTASETWSNRYGDCKDQTIVIYQLLKAAGIRSHPLLINTGSKLTPELPSLDQFDHMVIYVPSLSDQPVIDLVDTEFDPAFGPPHGLGGRMGLLCKDDNPHLIQIAEYPSPWKRPSVKVECEINLGEEPGKIEIRESLAVVGYYGSWLRQSYLDLEPKDYRLEVENTLRDYLPADSAVESVEISNLNDLNKPFTIDVRYTALADEGALEFLPAWKGYYLDMRPSVGRKQPYRFAYPFSIESVVEFDPEQIALEESSEEQATNSSALRFGHAAAEGRSDDDSKVGWRESRSLIGWQAVNLPVVEYYAFYDALDQALETATRQFQLRHGLSAASLQTTEP